MVLFVSCPTSSLVSSTNTTTTCNNDFNDDERGSFHRKSEPISVSRNRCCDDVNYNAHPLERLASPLATSAESVDSIKSSCSSRSSAEREHERAQRRQLLDVGLGKLRAQSNMPMRKHLLVFNTVKALQRDLDMLDDEDLYCSLLGMSNETTGNNNNNNFSNQMIGGAMADDMEIDEFNWLPKRVVSTPIGAPLKREEHRSNQHDTAVATQINNSVSNSIISTSLSDDDEFELEMETETATWSWTSQSSIFESIHNKIDKDESMFSWSSPLLSSASSGAEFGWNDSSPASPPSFNLWGSDPFGVARFDFQHLFPSQLLLQA
ncbi:unnamed protein product [Caenorhabditis angaria]|uniref:SERTA domain-containing protein n=1 Tax=Caenorhabditis angaria TaxID=860376 RepID=A0A9P1IY40_9PELO|nr:unnamed protein product [Caenorhabditis angaria]